MTVDPVALWSVIGLFLLAVAVSAVIVWRFLQMGRLIEGCAGWVQADAKVVGGHIEEIQTGDEYSFQPVVIFEYIVNGERYRADQLEIGPPKYYSFKRGAQGVLARYPVGMQILAWVDPSEPCQAVLERTVPFKFKTVLIVCFIVLWTATLGGAAVVLFSPGVVGTDPALRW